MDHRSAPPEDAYAPFNDDRPFEDDDGLSPRPALPDSHAAVTGYADDDVCNYALFNIGGILDKYHSTQGRTPTVGVPTRLRPAGEYKDHGDVTDLGASPDPGTPADADEHTYADLRRRTPHTW